MTALIDEISSAMNMDDPEIKVFDVFNIHADVTDSEREEKAIALFGFYGRPKPGIFKWILMRPEQFKVLTSVIMKHDCSSMRTLIW